MDRVGSQHNLQVQAQRLDEGNNSPLATASAAVADKQDQHPEPPAAQNAVIFIGARHDEDAVERIVEHCKLLKLDFTVIETRDDGLCDSRKNQLYFDGKLSPATQVFALFHGGLNEDTRQHELEVAHGAAHISTLDFMQWLRTPPASVPEGPAHAGFHGTIHLHSCKGNLRDELKAGSALWNMGSCIAYSSRKDTLIDTGIDSMLDILDKMVQSDKEEFALGAVEMLAHAAGISGDTIVGLGADFSGPLVIRAPKTLAETRSANLIEALQPGQESTNCIIGNHHDRQALLAALDKSSSRNDPRRDRMKLENTMVIRVARQDLERVSEFLAADPALSTVTMSDGTGLHELAGIIKNKDLLRTIMDCRHQTLRASFAERALVTCHAHDGQGLVPLLDQASEENFFLLDEEANKLADAVHKTPAMVAQLMAWACRQGHIGLVRALMKRQAESARSGFAQKNLAKADGPESAKIKTYLKQFCRAARKPAMRLGQQAAAALIKSGNHGIEKLLWEFRSARLFDDKDELDLLLKAVSDRPQLTDAMLEWASRENYPKLIDAISSTCGAPYVRLKVPALREIAAQANSPAVLDYLNRLGGGTQDAGVSH